MQLIKLFKIKKKLFNYQFKKVFLYFNIYKTAQNSKQFHILYLKL